MLFIIVSIIMIRLVEKCDTHDLNHFGRNCFMSICYYYDVGSVSVLKALLDAGSDVNCMDNNSRDF